jgi:choline dehydrogenase-like flavoprotein
VASDPATSRVARELQADVCVIGAGPAGLTFASAWVGSGRHLVILESGGHGLDDDAQDLDAGEIDSNYHLRDALSDGRRRQVGGTSNLWIYRTRPDDRRRYARALLPEPIDLRPVRPGSTSWPMSTSDLAPFHERATALWIGTSASHDLADWTGPNAQPICDPDGALQTRIVLHGPADAFGKRLRGEVLQAPNIDLLVGHTVLTLESDDGGASIARAVVARADGSRVRVQAGTFVLATGGIENVQLLLSSEATAPGGPGNRHDRVGRSLADHPEFRLGMVELEPGVLESLALYDLRRRDGTIGGAVLTLSDEVKREHKLLNLGVALVAQVDGFGTPTHRSLAAFRAAARGERPPGLSRHLTRILRTPRTALSMLAHRSNPYLESRGGWSLPEVDQTQIHRLELHASTEQSADPENRITLGSARDRLGRRRIAVRWRWSAPDRADIDRSIGLLTTAIGRAGVGSVDRWVQLEGPERPFDRGFHHPMGGTRMHEDPREGVVDPDLKVHGVSNLFVIGSSVFPTGHGYANPTLTLLALALQLAGHLQNLLG